MAAYAITKHVIEDFDINAVMASMETYIETLDSTNNPIVLANIMVHPKNGKFVGVVLAD